MSTNVCVKCIKIHAENIGRIVYEDKKPLPCNCDCHIEKQVIVSETK